MASNACEGGALGFTHLDFVQVTILGIVQGITELLPISSTAHMRVVPALLHWPDPGSAFSAAMQLAALAAVVSYFWRDVRDVTVGSLQALRYGQFSDRWLKLAVGIVIATIPIVVIGYLTKPVLNACNSPMRGLPVVGWACIGMAILLALAELFAQHRRKLEHASLLDSIVVGICQAGALIPGVSRSGSTLTAALGLGFKRDDAARFSFLLGIPAIAAAGLLEIVELHKQHLDAHGWAVLGVGLVVASISAFVAIWGLMRILERFSAWPFVIYRGVLGAVILVGVAIGWLH